MSKLILEATGLRKTYITGPQQVTVWQDIHLQVNAGETLAIVGASGSGKTTLLNALGGLDTVDEGQVLIDGKDLSSMNETQRTALRNQEDRKSTRLNSSHVRISYAVFCLKKKSRAHQFCSTK